MYSSRTTSLVPARAVGKTAVYGGILSTKYFLWDPESKTFSTNLSTLQNEGIMQNGPCNSPTIALASTKTKAVKHCRFLKKTTTPRHAILDWHWRSADMTFDVIVVNDLNFV